MYELVMDNIRTAFIHVLFNMTDALTFLCSLLDMCFN